MWAWQCILGVANATFGMRTVVHAGIKGAN
jgi:hypothetical protein